MLAAALLAGVLAAACSRGGGADVPTPPRAFCDAARELDEQLPRQPPLRVQIRLVRRLAETAPPRVEDEARTFLEALERVRSDPSVRDDPDVRRAVDEVNRYAAQGCGFYERNSPL